MLLLASTSDIIRVVTGATGDIDVHASYIDMTTADPPVVKGSTSGRLNTIVTGATTTTVVAAPAASTTRNVKTLHIANVHASTSNTITVQHFDGTTSIDLEQVTLLAGERLAYVEGQGFEYIDANGVTKAPTAMVYTQRLAATQSNSTTTATEVTGLSLATPVGTWVFEYFLIFRSATTTVGPKLSVNYDGTVTSFVQTLMTLTVNATDSSGAIDQDATAMQVVGGMAKRVKDATGTMIGTVGVDTANADEMIYIQGLAVVTVAGNFELWHGSETATSTSIMADSALRLTKVG